MHRRRFLESGAALGALAGVSAVLPALAATTMRSPGLQLFTVMNDLERDFAGTLAAVAAIGYQEVETIGAFGRDPAWVRDQLDANGLVSPSQHLVPGDLYEAFRRFTRREVEAKDIEKHWAEVMSVDRVQPIIEEAVGRAKILGQRYIVWQIIWPEQMATRALLDRFRDAMDQAGRLCAAEGLVFCFHNHARELEPLEGVVPFDHIIETTDPDRVKIEMDAYWVTKGGGDPAAYLEKYPGRILQTHLKDSTVAGDFETIGKGTVDFEKLIAAERKARVRHSYVEYDRSADPMTAILESWTYLQKLF